jgi:UPF0716 family protein affecting phage T7 exclusion
MFDLFDGLPVHALVVHAVVVLAPLTALLAVIYAVAPARRLGLRWPLLGIAVVAGVGAYVAKESGEKLERRVGDPGDHAVWGDRAFIATGLLVLVTLLVVLVLAPVARRAVHRAVGTAEANPNVHADAQNAVDGPAAEGRTEQLTTHPHSVVAAESGARRAIALLLSLLVAAGVWFTVFEAGHSGATKVWGDQVKQSAPADNSHG